MWIDKHDIPVLWYFTLVVSLFNTSIANNMNTAKSDAETNKKTTYKTINNTR